MLLAHHLVDVDHEQPPFEKLQELEARQTAWSTLTPRKVDYNFEVEGATSIYELQEGIFLHTEGDIGWLEQMRGVKVRPGAMVNLTCSTVCLQPHLLRMIPLPWSDDSLMKQVPRQTRDVGFDVADLTFDPTQDLIVISEKLSVSLWLLTVPNPFSYRFLLRCRKYEPTQGDMPLLRYHLLTISTLEPHPLATRIPLFSIDASARIRNVYQLLQVFGDILAVSATPANSIVQEHAHEQQEVHPHMVRIFNWKTGQVMSVSNFAIPASPVKRCLYSAFRNLSCPTPSSRRP